MANYIDRLEQNLKKQVEVLEKIFESNKRFTVSDQAARSQSDTYDEYLEEQNSYLEELDDLDVEFDEINGYITSHPSEVSSTGADQKQRIRTLISEIGGKSEAVLAIESKAAAIVDSFLAERKNEISETRRNTRVLNDHYRLEGYRKSINNSVFDTTN